MKKRKNTLFWLICISTILVGCLLFTIGISLGGAASFSITNDGINFYSFPIFTRG